MVAVSLVLMPMAGRSDAWLCLPGLCEEGESVSGVRFSALHVADDMKGVDLFLGNTVTNCFEGLAVDPLHHVQGTASGLQVSLWGRVAVPDKLAQLAVVSSAGNGGEYVLQIGGYNAANPGIEKGNRKRGTPQSSLVQIGGVNNACAGALTNHSSKVFESNAYAVGQAGVVNFARTTHYAVQLGLFNGAGTVRGLAARAGVVNTCKHNWGGLSVGIVNLTGAEIDGIDVGLANLTGSLEGMQFGLWNDAEATVTGAQIGFINLGGSLKGGLQIGVVNKATKIDDGRHGWQIGILNYGQSKGTMASVTPFFRGVF
jgi:hypothetical protein